MKHIIVSVFLIQSAIEFHGQWNIVFNNDECTFHSTFFINDSVGFVIGSCMQDAVVLKTSDFGQSWYEVYSEDVNYFYDVYFPSETTGYISTYNKVLKTTNAGESWYYPDPTFEGFPYRSIVFQDEEVGFGCFADGGTAFATTIDGGNTWIENYAYGGRELLIIGDCEIRVISSQYGKSNDCWGSYETSYSDIGDRTKLNFAMPDGNIILICGIGYNDDTLENFGFTGRSGDEGESWNIVDFEHTQALHSVVSVNENVAYCVGHGKYPLPYSILKSIDGGLSWNYQTYDFPCNLCYSPEIRDVFCASENVCYAVGSSGAIWRTLNGGGELFAMTIDEEQPVGMDKFQLFPNPSSSSITVTIPMTLDCNEILILNHLGQMVSNYPLNGQKTLSIDVNDFAPGLYLVQSNNSLLGSVKFIKN